MAKQKASTAGLRYLDGGRYEEWTGTADDLIGAGLVSPDMLPGTPGNNKFSATFVGGAPVKRGTTHPRDENYLQILRLGKSRYRVSKWRSQNKSSNAVSPQHLAATVAADINETAASSSTRIDPRFKVGQIVEVQAYSGTGTAKISDCQWYQDPRGAKWDAWSYAVDPNPSEWRCWFHERCLHPYTLGAVPIWLAAMKRKNGVLRPTTGTGVERRRSPT